MLSRAVVLIAILGGACTANDDVPAPVLGSVSPTSASPGAVLQITGSYLCQQNDAGSDEDPLECQNTGNVDFGAAPETPTMWTDTAVTVEVPELAAGEVDLSVTVAGRSSNSISFTVE